MQISLTYVAQIAQFFVVLGFITESEFQIIEEAILAISSLIILGLGLYGRYRAGGINVFGIRK